MRRIVIAIFVVGTLSIGAVPQAGARTARSPGAASAVLPPDTCLGGGAVTLPSGAEFEVSSYSFTDDCSIGLWRFEAYLTAFNDPSDFGSISVELDTDHDATTGCDGVDVVVSGSLSAGGALPWVTHMWRTPTCSTQVAVHTSATAGNSGTHLWLHFGQADIGDPTAMTWRASVSNLAGDSVDHIPSSGAVDQPGVPTIADAYWLVDSEGHVQSYGPVERYGDLSGHPLAAPIVGMARVPDNQGYWLLGRDGGVFSYGDAHFYGSTGNLHLNAPVVAMAATPSGHGYWFVASDGGIFSYGDAHFYGSTGALHLNRPIVGMAPTPSGHGYWLVASDGGVFSFGDARFYGSTGAIHLVQPIVGLTPTPSGHGYWFAAADGGVFSYGDAQFHGSAADRGLGSPVVAIRASHSGGGYRFVNEFGSVVDCGDVYPYHNTTGPPFATGIVAIG